jgi:hypothetical protein
MTTIMIQISDDVWTTQAVHLACAMARKSAASGAGSVALLRLIPAQHVRSLGFMQGADPIDPALAARLDSYAMIAAQYGIEITLNTMQYEALDEALAQAVEQLGASALFAPRPQAWLGLWSKFQIWTLKRMLSAQHCEWHSLQNNSGWTPTVAAAQTR